MRINVKRHGSVVAVVLALCAMSAQTASATDFHIQAAHSNLSGINHSGEDTLTVNAGTVRCSSVLYSGTQSAYTATTLTVTPSYSGCKAFGFIGTTVDTNGCSYRFDSNGNNVDIICGFNPITITAFNCWVTVGSQENIGFVTYTNQGAGLSRDITIDMNLGLISYTQHSKSFPGCTNGSFSNANYTGALTLRAFDTSGNQVGIWAQ